MAKKSRRSNFTSEQIQKNQDKLFGKDKKRVLPTYEQNRDNLRGNNKDDKKSTNKTSSKFIKYKVKMYRRGTPGAKKAEAAEAARKRLGSKNYMSKENIAKRNKRLKINK